jgi:flagellar hook-length control protein FliK
MEEKFEAALEALGSRISAVEQQVTKLTEAMPAKNVDEKESEVVQESGDATQSSDAKPPGGGRRRRSRRGKRLRKSRKSRRSRRH